MDGKLPLVFLDEFDSRNSNYPLLLPLLWDGELDVGNRDLRVGRSVFFLAGSRPSLPNRLADAREMFTSKGEIPDEDKLLDLFSRINGGVIEVRSLRGGDSAAEKVVIAMQLLRNRFKMCTTTTRALLAFISRVTFRYEARSIATFINMIRAAPDVTAVDKEDLNQLPFQGKEQLKDSPLAFHLMNEDGPRALCDLWRECSEVTGEQLIRDSYLEASDVGPFGTWEWAQFAWTTLAQPGVRCRPLNP